MSHWFHFWVNWILSSGIIGKYPLLIDTRRQSHERKNKRPLHALQKIFVVTRPALILCYVRLNPTHHPATDVRRWRHQYHTHIGARTCVIIIVSGNRLLSFECGPCGIYVRHILYSILCNGQSIWYTYIYICIQIKYYTFYIAHNICMRCV